MTQSTSQQRRDLYKLFGYCKDAETMHVQHITNGKGKIAKDLSMAQANELKKKLVTNWAKFSITNQQHKYILSLLIQLSWSKQDSKFGEIADMARLSSFLKSKKSPVPKPLQEMSPTETSKLISCLESMVAKSYK
ncbi:hypothetical protein Peternella1_11 [Winogradskyella phage Peternella_1]|uniref:Uncharacterized protein n=1 Tax=Winogradskyella phage Peternella_1 TaxID=2745699 RepID=A0A8E4ZMY5_9CAUD|nr:hypothetical protein M1M32_gp11 [Winogradskyella phage Peternella_1]QQV91547.1 hypothetical protein Peternella1_11 [Winogradskyella phage Peternella_1]